MKKVLLMLVAFVATMSMSAETIKTGGWNATFTPVEADDTEDLDAPKTAVASDGSVFVASTYTKAFTFAGKALADPEDMISSCIVKYNNKGEEQWAVSFVGNATITAMTTDGEGALYVAGGFDDEVKYTGTDDATASINSGEGGLSAFVAKISKDGKFEAVKVIKSSVNAEIYAIEGDPYDMGFDMPLYDLSGNDPMYVQPTSIMVAGDKVYVSATYTGDVEELGWKGAYCNYFDMMVFDMRSMGIFSMSKADLSAPQNVAYAQTTGTVTYGTQNWPESFKFVIKSKKLYALLYGFGSLTVTTAAGAQDVVFDSDFEGNNEHGIALFRIDGNNNRPLVFHAAIAEAPLSATYSITDVDAYAGTLLFAGTFHGDFPLTKEVETNTFDAAYVAAIDLGASEVKWTQLQTTESKSVGMDVTGEEIHAVSTLGMTGYKTATGEVKGSEEIKASDGASCDDAYVAYVYVDGTDVKVVAPEINVDTAVESIDLPSAETNGQRVNLAGQPVDDSYKGIVIEDGKMFYAK